MTTQTMSIIELLAEAGWAMVPIYICSLVGLAVFIRKTIEFRTAGVHRSEVLASSEKLIADGDWGLVLTHCEKEGSPLGLAMAATARAVKETPKRAEEEVARYCAVQLQKLEAHLPVLSFVAQVAPLFGLLGTVLGMVDLFSGMEAAGQSVDTSTLSAGIWKALLTTAAGLIVGIPSMGAHAWLVSQSDALRVRMQDGAQRILNRAFGKG